jgi:C4-dicarboxylate-specific signal transduction histidine kinase
MNAVVLRALAGLVLACDAWAGTVQDERAAREECSAYSEAGMRECLAKKASASSAALKQAEDKVRNTLAKWDEDAKYVSLARSKLEASTKEFTKYRQAHCAFNASLGGGAIGNALEMMRLACVFELNIRRAEQLKSAIVDLPTK